MEFYERYTNSTDAEILEILKRRNDYQDSAVQAALKVAIERQLIYSEQDLLSPEFQVNKSEHSWFFPEPSNLFQREKLVGSIFRFLYVLSFLPIFYGFMKYSEGQLNLTLVGVVMGLIWFILSFLLSKSRRKVILIPMFALLIAVFFTIGLNLFGGPDVRYPDLLVLFTGTLLPLYLLLLLRRLI